MSDSEFVEILSRLPKDTRVGPHDAWLARPADIVGVLVGEQASCAPVNASESWWGEVDAAVLECLAGGETMTLTEIGRRLGMSEEAVTSIVAMLAQEGKLQISLVASASTALVEPAMSSDVPEHEIAIAS